jgi:hypothetical protein
MFDRWGVKFLLYGQSEHRLAKIYAPNQAFGRQEFAECKYRRREFVLSASLNPKKKKKFQSIAISIDSTCVLGYNSREGILLSRPQFFRVRQADFGVLASTPGFNGEVGLFFALGICILRLRVRALTGRADKNTSAFWALVFLLAFSTGLLRRCREERIYLYSVSTFWIACITVLTMVVLPSGLGFVPLSHIQVGETVAASFIALT